MGLLEALPIHGRHHVHLDCDLSPEGIEQIRRYLEDNIGVNFIPSPTWRWDWEVTQRGGYTGTLTTRLASWCHKHGRDLSPHEKRHLGQIAGSARHPSHDYYFDFDNELKWQSGEFGDRPSCFFSHAHESRQALQECGWLAMRFYADNTYEKGIGRLLLFQRDKCLIAMNGYTAPDEDAHCDYNEAVTGRFAGVLADWLHKPIKRVFLDRGEGSGRYGEDGDESAIYANGCMGFVIGESEHDRFTLNDQPEDALVAA